MKYVYIYIILFVFVAGCRSSHQRDTSYRESEETEKTTMVVRSDSTRTEDERETSTATVTNIQEYTRTTDYNDDGSVSRVQEQWRGTGSVQLAQSSGRSSAVSLTTMEEKTELRSLRKADMKELKKSASDTRLIQGWEWAVVIVTIVLVVAVIIFIKKRKK